MLTRAPDEILAAAGPLVLSRAWPRDRDHLVCEYADAGAGAVAAQWFADPRRLRAVAERIDGDVEVVAAAGVLLQRGGADRRLPALRSLVGAPGAVLVAHRPERRAVVRRSGTYTKVVRPERAAAVRERLARVAACAAGVFRTPALRAWDEQRGLVVCDALAGCSLHALGASPEAAAGWERAGRALARLHDGPLDGLPAHTAGAEAALVRARLADAAAFGVLPPVDPARALAPLVGAAGAPLGLLHRDLHDKQLLHEPGEPIGLLDVDTLAVGERALDLANLLVHLELRVRQGRLPADFARTAAARFVQAYSPDPATCARIGPYATAARLRLAAVYAFRPRWRTLARGLLAGSASTTDVSTWRAGIVQ
ncbi:MAG TPA: hypothetical protein VFG79_03870 [Solirubrobacter sp.]|nr:hypothetical protein [Solirubrobacter sp.]